MSKTNTEIIAELKTELQNLDTLYKGVYQSPESVYALQKTIQSFNITITDWNTLLTYINSHRSSLDGLLEMYPDFVDAFDEITSNLETEIATKANSADVTSALETINTQLALKADKVGPLPEFTVNETDDVIDFITTNNINGKPIILKIGTTYYFATLINRAIAGHNIVSFEIEECGGSSPAARYGGSNGIVTNFRDIINDNFRRDYELQDNKVQTITNNSTTYPSSSAVYDALTTKQDTLHSGTNIKTINGESLLGSGNIVIQGGGGDAEWGSIGGDIADQTDLQNEFQNVREVAEGKTSTYVIYDDIEGLTEQTFVANEYKRADGTPIATWADFLSYVEDSNTCSNTLFDDDSVYKIDVGYTYLITVYNRIIKTNTLKNGDNIIVVQLDVPDRWYNEEDGCAYPLETSKIDLDNYSTKTETSTEVNKVAHDIAVEYNENTLYGSGDLCIKDKLLYKCNTNNTTGTWDSTKWDLTTVNSELGIIKASGQSYTDNKLLNYATKIGSLPSYTFNSVSQLISQFVEANSIPLKTPFVLLGISDGPYIAFIDKGSTNYTFRGYCLRYKQYIDYYGPDTYVVNLLGQQSSYAHNLVDAESTQTISGIKTFRNGINFDNPSSARTFRIFEDVYNQLLLRTDNNFLFIFSQSAFTSYTTNTKDLGSQAIKWRNLYISGGINPNTNGYKLTLPDTTNFTADSEVVDTASAQTISGVKDFINGLKTSNLDFSGNQISMYRGSTLCYVIQQGAILFFGNDIGSPSRKAKDLHLSGTAYSSIFTSTNSNTNISWGFSSNQYSNMQIERNGIGMFSVSSSAFFPNSNNVKDLGTNSLRFRDAYINRYITDSTNSVTVADLANLIAYAKAQGWIS